MKNKRYIFVLLSAAFVAQAVSAGYGEDYDAAIDSIVSNNRALAARRAALEGDRLSLAAENNLSDPEVEFEHQWGQGHIGNKWSVSVSQSFDWPGLYKRRAEVARSGADAFRLLYEAEAADLRLRVAMALNDYVASCQRLSLANEVKNNLDSLYFKLSKSSLSSLLCFILFLVSFAARAMMPKIAAIIRPAKSLIILLSPVLGESTLVGVSGSVILTVWPSSSMSLCSAILIFLAFVMSSPFL